jgi:Leucine-rich repeat (LRR) protein
LHALLLLQVSCCNTTNPCAELVHLLQHLPQLQQLTYTTSVPAVVDYAMVAAVAAHGSLTHIELHNFIAPASSYSSSSTAGITATAAAAAAGPCPAVFKALHGLALQKLQSLKLVDFDGSSRLLPMLAAATAGRSISDVALKELQLARSRQDGFMPALLAGMFSDSDSDSDSDSESEDSVDDTNDADGSSEAECIEDGKAASASGSGCCGGASSSGCCGRASSSSKATAAAAAAAVLRSRNSLQQLSCGSAGSAATRLRSSFAPLALLHTLVDLDLSGLGISDIGPVVTLTMLTSLKLGPMLGAAGSSQHVNRIDSSGIAGIGALQQLQHLDVSHNQLRWGSVLLLQELTGLTYLRLAGNNLSSSSTQVSPGCSNDNTVWMCSSKAISVDARAACYGSGGSSSSSSSSGCCASGDGCLVASSSEDEAPTPKSRGSSAHAAAAFGGTAGSSKASADRRRLLLRCDSTISSTTAAATLRGCCNMPVNPAQLQTSSSSSSMWLLPGTKLRHLDVSGCGLNSIFSLAAPRLPETSEDLASSLLANLTCLKAGTSLRHMGSGIWHKKANHLTPACVASLAALTNLRDIEVAAEVPAGCYAGFRGLGQLTRLVVQDFAAAEGIFQPGCNQAAGGCGSSSRVGCSAGSSSCCFPLIEELGLMLRGPAGAAAISQLATSCRDLRKLVIYQDLTSPPATAAGQCDGCCSGSTAACGSAGLDCSSWHCAALSGLMRLQQLSLQPPADIRVLTCLTGLRHLQLLGPEAGWRPDRSATGQPDRATAQPGIAATAAAAAVARPVAKVEVLPAGGCCGGGGTSAEVTAAAAAGSAGGCCVGGCCAAPAVASSAGCCSNAAAGAARATAAAAGGGCRGGAACCEDNPTPAAATGMVAASGVRCVTDAELLGLGILTKLTHLELQHVVFNDSAVDELQRLLPCTRISV